MKTYLKTHFYLIFSLFFLFNFVFTETMNCGDIDFYENREYNNFPEMSGFSNVSAFREVIDLNGIWEYKKKSDSEFKEVFLPSCYDYKGKVIFKKEFNVDSTFAGKFIKLFLYGINYSSSIKINGRLIGNNVGGYSSFSFEIPDNIIKIAEKNIIEIEVDNRLNLIKTIPIKQQVYGWKNYGGIFREIFIVGFPRVSIDEVDVDYDFSDELKNCRNNVKIKIKNFNILTPGTDNTDVMFAENIAEIGYGIELYNSEDNSLILKIDSKNEFLKIHRSGIGELKFEIKDVQLWDVDKPKLYELRVYITKNKLKIDEERILIGYRNIKINNGDIYVNNKKVKLWGILYQEDYPGLGSALNWNILEKDILKIKNLGFNLVQSYYPLHPYFHELCDKHGIFIIESLPIWNVPAVCFENEDFNELSINYIKEIIKKYKKYASVIAWGIGGEFESSDISAVNFVKKTVEVIKSFDSRFSFLTSKIIEDEKCAEFVDLPGLNLYTNSPEVMDRKLKVWKKKFPDKPLIVSRYGVDFLSLGFNEEIGSTLMDYHASILKNFYEKIVSNPDIDISILWSYSDWKVEKPMNIVPSGLDQYLYLIGLTDYNRNERISYGVIKSLKTEGKPLSIFSGSFKSDEPYEYQIIGFILIVLLIFPYKKNRKFSENLRRALFYPKGFFHDIIQGRTLSSRQIIFLGILLSVIFSVILSSIFYFFRFSKEFDYFISQFILNDMVKEIIGRLTWKPLHFIFYFSIFYFFFLFVVSWLVYIWGIFQKQSLPFESAAHVVFWSGAINLFLIPLAMILYPALQYKGFFVFILIILFLFFVWNIIRLISIVSISYRVRIRKVIIEFSLTALAAIIIISLYFQSNYNTYDFLKFFVNIYN